MTDPRGVLRSYLEARETLGEPELFLPAGQRGALFERLRTVGAGGGEPAASGEAEQGIVRRGSGEDVLEITDMGRLREVAEACTRCELHNTRTHVVFSDGNPGAELMCVGEAPGANEDRTGLPFVGRAGKLLDRLLLSVGFPRAEVFICNVLKCRPPGNRNPLPGEIESCSPFLLRQVELVRPTVIVTFGTFAAQTLLGVRDSLRHLRGRTHLYEGVPLVVTYHPAALLRNPGWTRPTWLDLQLARRIADGDQGQLAARGPEKEHSRPESSDGPEAAEDQLTLEGRDA